MDNRDESNFIIIFDNKERAKGGGFMKRVKKQ